MCGPTNVFYNCNVMPQLMTSSTKRVQFSQWINVNILHLRDKIATFDSPGSISVIQGQMEERLLDNPTLFKAYIQIPTSETTLSAKQLIFQLGSNFLTFYKWEITNLSIYILEQDHQCPITQCTVYSTLGENYICSNCYLLQIPFLDDKFTSSKMILLVKLHKN